MFVARGSRSLGRATLAWTLSFTSKIWYLAVDRRGLTYDTRFVPAAPGPARSNACIYFVLAGRMAVGTDLELDARQCAILSEEQMEGADGTRSTFVRATGEPFRAVQIFLPDAQVCVAPEAFPRVVTLSQATWTLATDLLDASAGRDDAATLTSVGKLAASLEGEGLVTHELAASSLRPASAASARLWKAVRPLIEKFVLTPTVQEVSSAAGIPTRQIDALVRGFVTGAGHLGGGWRAGTKHVRLKLAVLLLSAEDASVAEVAKAVGYGSSDAMARAFRDAGLGAPSSVREAIRAAAASAHRTS